MFAEGQNWWSVPSRQLALIGSSTSLTLIVAISSSSFVKKHKAISSTCVTVLCRRDLAVDFVGDLSQMDNGTCGGISYVIIRQDAGFFLVVFKIFDSNYLCM